jgi:predicted dienelactone hydrolase
MQAAAWLPQESSAAGAPVILFSHGFHGCAVQSSFLMEAFSEAGYAVFAVDHADAACGNPLKWFGTADVPFRYPERWEDSTYAARAMDMERLLDAASRDPRFASLDWKHVGLAGHSLGGYTVLGLAGGWPSWTDHRVKAVLALSPYSAPFMEHHTLALISIPVMYQGGTRDYDITPFVKRAGGSFDQTPRPKFYIELDGAGHLAWTNATSRYHDAVDAYSIAFFDAYLKGKPFPPPLLEKGMSISAIRAEAE